MKGYPRWWVGPLFQIIGALLVLGLMVGSAVVALLLTNNLLVAIAASAATLIGVKWLATTNL